jgi:hypothetical protein
MHQYQFYHSSALVFILSEEKARPSLEIFQNSIFPFDIGGHFTNIKKAHECHLEASSQNAEREYKRHLVCPGYRKEKPGSNWRYFDKALYL